MQDQDGQDSIIIILIIIIIIIIIITTTTTGWTAVTEFAVLQTVCS